MATMIRIGITGKPGVGKSTIVKTVIEGLRARNFSIGGILTSEVREGGRRVGFIIEDINTGRKGILAHINQQGPKVGKYGVNMKDLDDLGAKAIREAKLKADIIIIDEIGPMELKSRNFIDAVEEAMDSDKNMIVTVHQRSREGLVRKIKDNFEMFEVTEENRGGMAEEILKRVNREILR
ncbi:MAG: NTPase [Candidatus Methanospirareceae archaeon]